MKVRDALRSTELFGALSDADIDRLLAKGDRVSVDAGAVLFEEGDPGDRAYIVESGELEILKQASLREILVKTSGPGAVIGEMAVLQAMPRTATVRAATDATLLAIDGDAFRELVEESTAAARSILGMMFDRWRETDAALREAEKLAQLGSLSAGVTHELNNPAAAIGRAAAQLDGLLAEPAGDLPAQWQALDRQIGDRPVLGSMPRSDAEDAVEEALAAAGVVDGWDDASTLVDLGVAPESIPRLMGAVADPAATLASLTRRHTARLLAREIADAAGRISAIVGALRSYTYLDRGAVQEVDLNRGLADTLVMVKSRLSGLDVVTEYDVTLPLIEGHGGELNQVWTNLVVNAADALGGSGRMAVRTRREGSWALVEVEDDGAGIPEDVIGHIFDPFFTTKPVGHGTGLGLDISRHIIQDQHRGDLSVESRPGHTVFTVRLPLEDPGLP